MPTPPAGSATVDLTTNGNFGLVNDGVFLTGQVQPAGTGAFNSFVQIQRNGTEQGYNTDASAQFDEKNSQQHNHSILLADVPIVIGGNDPGTVEGVVYREFLLDLNEPNGGGKNYISLDALQLWQEEAGNLTNFNTTTGFAGAHTNYKAYDLDSGGNHWIALNDGLSHGSGQSDVRVLIPDSVFINDAAHRYVTLYSAMGGQSADWNSGGGFEEWGLHGASGGSRTALNVSKAASVGGGTADHDGEIITYSITLSNTGNQSLTGITVTDPSVSDLTRGLDQVGNNDNVLNVGEVWTYSAHHVVTQGEIDSAASGGEGFINNTVSAGSDQTGHLVTQLDTASASVPVEARPLATLDKSVSSITTSDETLGHVNAAGDVIHYTVTAVWGTNGNVTLSNPVVTDPSIIINPIVDHSAPILNPNAQIFVPVLDGDNNLGDNNNNGIVDPTDQNNVRDPGETWQYVYNGDTNQDGFHDPGETWAFPTFNLGDTNNDHIHQAGETWVGDTNQNGIEEAGEKWQFKNVWDTNDNGLQDNGEVWHYQNIGDTDQSGTQNGDETFQYYNVGDTNQNGNEDPGETFQYYNVGDTNHDGMEDNGETFQFNHVLPGVDANNDGFNDGDTNQDGKINATETWLFTANYTVTQDDIDNRVNGIPTVNPNLTHDNTATLNADPNVTASDSASVAIDQHPHLSVTKMASIPDANTAGDPTLNDGKIDSPADDITYTIRVVNDGNMTLTGVTVNDSVVGPHPLTAHTETGGAPATNGDGELNVGETWTYTAVYNTQQSDIDNRGSVDGTADNNIHNTASVTTTQGAGGSASADVPIDYRPHLSVTKAASIPDTNTAGDPTLNDGKIDSPADDITYTITVVNDGNVTLTGVNANDSVVGALTTHTETGGAPATNGDGILNVGETWTYTAVYDTQQSDIDNHGSVDSTADNNIHNTATVTTTQGASGSASADVPIDYRPHLTVDKVASIPDTNTAGDPTLNDGKIDSPADDITYTVTVVNDGNVTLTGVSANDSIVGPLTSHTDSGAGTHGDASLDVGETWTYTAVYDTQQSDIDNHGSVDGTADNNIHNTATVTSTQGAGGSDSADVPIDYNPNFTFSVTALGYHDENGNNTADDGDIIDFSVLVTNTGNVTLTSIGISNEDGLIAFQNGPIASLATGGSDGTMTGTHLIQGGETNLDETEVGQSDQVGNILVPVHVEFADLEPLSSGGGGGAFAAMASEGGASSGSGPIILPADSEAAMGISIPMVIGGDPGAPTDLSGYDIAGVMSGGFNAGDANHTGYLDGNEAWEFTASQNLAEVASLLVEFNSMGNAIDVNWHWL